MTAEFNGPETAVVMMGGAFMNPYMIPNNTNLVASFLFSIIHDTEYEGFLLFCFLASARLVRVCDM